MCHDSLNGAVDCPRLCSDWQCSKRSLQNSTVYASASFCCSVMWQPSTMPATLHQNAGKQIVNCRSRSKYRAFVPIVKPSRLCSANAPRSKVTTAATPADTAMEQLAAPAPQANDWNQFVKSVSGEWEGVTATFSPSGQPQPLPEYYVPEAFREWGVELWDWQSQCSSLASADVDGAVRTLKSSVRRIMPTVGCEADAIAFTEEDASSSSSADIDSSYDSTSLLYTESGSYNIGPSLLQPVGQDAASSKFQVEHCFNLPDTVAPDSSCSSRFRVKVVQQFRRDWSTGAWLLSAVDLHRERYDGPYTGKRELAGCGGGQPGIAQLPALQANCLSGKWVTAEVLAFQGHEGSSSGTGSPGCDGSQDRLQGAEDVPEGQPAPQVAGLPLQTWSAVCMSPEGQLQVAEAGVMLSPHSQHQQGTDLPPETEVHSEDREMNSRDTACRLVSCLVYDSSTGQLKSASLTRQQAA